MNIRPIVPAVLAVALVIAVAASPVYVLTISEGGNEHFARPVPLGDRWIARYIHSVEKTPVEDEYRITEGRIWIWEERVVSQNAGLPIIEPGNGRLVADGEWFRFRGGRSSMQTIYYRVGDDNFGRNVLVFFIPFPKEYEIFRIFPGKRIEISVKVSPLACSLLRERLL
jgi:hypothetical protein